MSEAFSYDSQYIGILSLCCPTNKNWKCAPYPYHTSGAMRVQLPTHHVQRGPQFLHNVAELNLPDVRHKGVRCKASSPRNHPLVTSRLLCCHPLSGILLEEPANEILAGVGGRKRFYCWVAALQRWEHVHVEFYSRIQETKYARYIRVLLSQLL